MQIAAVQISVNIEEELCISAPDLKARCQIEDIVTEPIGCEDRWEITV